MRVEAVTCRFMTHNHQRKPFIPFCVVYHQQDYDSSPSRHPRKESLEDIFYVGTWISTDLADIQMRIETHLTNPSKNRNKPEQAQ